MQLIVPLLIDMGVNAAWVSAAVLSARVALFAHRFIKSRSL